MSDNIISFRMTNKENCFQCFRPKVEAFGEEHGLPKKVIFHLTLVLDELVTNIIDYGYADFDEHPIDVAINLDEEIITIRLEDDSEPFNILEAPEPDLEAPLEERDHLGGMGIHLVKNMVDGIAYAREDNKNVLLLTKKFNKNCCSDDE
ncbi:MAG: ATP-binding protein [Pseudodesulfovibrio sp.]